MASVMSPGEVDLFGTPLALKRQRVRRSQAHAETLHALAEAALDRLSSHMASAVERLRDAMVEYQSEEHAGEIDGLIEDFGDELDEIVDRCREAVGI